MTRGAVPGWRWATEAVMPHISLVIFDCDGVLVDSERISHGVLQAMLAERGVVLTLEQTVDRFIGTSAPECLARISQLLGSPLPDGFRAELAARTQQAFSQQLARVAGIDAVLPSLRVPFCVASNGNRAKVDFTLGHTGLLSLFEGRIFTADDVRHPKPAPDLFLHAAAAMRVEPHTTVVVEDTPTGVRAAKAAGMQAIGFAAMTPASRLVAEGADAIALSMDELRTLLAGCGACR